MPPSGLDFAQETIAPDERAVTAEFIEFLTAASKRRHPNGPIPRFNQGRASGCVEADFIVPDGLTPTLRVGMFARPRAYRALIRFANASSASDREKDVRGMAIALRDVEGENLTPGSMRQDFVLNSHPVMMVPGTREFLDLLRAVDAGGARRAWYFLSHPTAARVAFASRRNHTSHLEIPYWSTTPYLFGKGRAVKYLVRPTATAARTAPQPLTDTYLRDALRARLRQGEASFDFLIQFRIDTGSMPLDDATVEWKERDSPYMHVARIVIPRQDIDGRDAQCDETAFNPWHCLAEHRPLGNMNRARREIYAAMATLRAERRARV
jgi:catalase